MDGKIIIFIYCILSLNLSAFSQCVEKSTIWKRVVFLRDSSTISAGDQLSELLRYDSVFTSCKYKTDSVRTLLLQRIGVGFLKLSDFWNAEKYIKSAISIINENGAKLFINPRLQGRNYYILSLIYDSLKLSKEQAKAEDSCISVSMRAGSVDLFLLYSIKKLVEYYYNLGDYYRCINYSKEGEFLVTNKIPNKDSLIYMSDFMTWKVNSLFQLNEFDQAQKLLEEKLEESKSADLSDFLGTIYERMAFLKIQKKQYSDALIYYNKALVCDKKKKYYMSYLETLLNMGFDLYDNKLHDNKNALRSYDKAIYFALLLLKHASSEDSAQIKIELLNIYCNKGDIYAKTGRRDLALYNFEKAFFQINVALNEDISFSNFNNKLILDLGFIQITTGLLDFGESLITAYKSSGDKVFLQKAAQIFATVDKLQFFKKTEQTDIQSKLFWRNFLRRLYENAIQTSYLSGDADGAFQYFENGRAVLLNDEVSRQKYLNSGDIFKLGRLKRKILQENMDLSRLPATSNHRKFLQNAAFADEQELNTLEQYLKNNNKLYYQSILDTGAIHIRNVQTSILKTHRILLELFDGDSAVYVLMIYSAQSFLYKIDKTDFDHSAGLYSAYISDPEKLNREYSQFCQTSHHLFELIFPNLQVPKGRMIVSPDGRYFPFESLITNKNFSTPEYFINDHAVSYTYSVRFLLNDFIRSDTSSARDFLGIAPIVYPEFSHLSSLPQSDFSLYNISSYFNGTKILIDSKASKENFLKQSPDYKIIQLYTHSSDNTGNKEPVIFFADSGLYLSELIPEHKSATQLIVLSACETGNGKDYKGEGVFSFNRGFASLGIPSSVINLWSIDNKSTYKLTELFYKYTATGLPLDISLQKAKLEFIATSSKAQQLPYYWAAAILAGKTDSIQFEKHYPILEILIPGMLAILLLIVMGYSQYKLNKSTRDQGAGIAGL